MQKCPFVDPSPKECHVLYDWPNSGIEELKKFEENLKKLKAIGLLSNLTAFSYQLSQSENLCGKAKIVSVPERPQKIIVNQPANCKAQPEPNEQCQIGENFSNVF
jgi:hypothetical protein